MNTLPVAPPPRHSSMMALNARKQAQHSCMTFLGTRFMLSYSFCFFCFFGERT